MAKLTEMLGEEAIKQLQDAQWKVRTGGRHVRSAPPAGAARAFGRWPLTSEHLAVCVRACVCVCCVVQTRLDAMEAVVAQLPGQLQARAWHPSLVLQGIAQLPGWDEKNFQVRPPRSSGVRRNSCAAPWGRLTRCVRALPLRLTQVLSKEFEVVRLLACSPDNVQLGRKDVFVAVSGMVDKVRAHVCVCPPYSSP